MVRKGGLPPLSQQHSTRLLGARASSPAMSAQREQLVSLNASKRQTDRYRDVVLTSRSMSCHEVGTTNAVAVVCSNQSGLKRLSQP
jgi:hypothetical protein